MESKNVEISTPYTIRAATFKDVDILSAIGAKTFYETFASLNTEDNMKLYLEKNFTREQMEREVNDKASTFFLSFDKEVVVGYAKLRTHSNPTEVAEPNTIEIERIYCIREYLGKKVGQILMQTCIDTVSQRGYETVWLGVWDYNPRAIAFYERWGFEKFGSHPFLLGTDLQTDLLMKKKLN